MRQRIWEIDCLRGIAILLMVTFHLIVDLKDFYHFPFEYLSGFWYYEGKLSAVLFMFLAGVSSTLNSRSLRHGSKVLAAALVVMLVTYAFNPQTYVRFGILHLLGTAILLSPLLLKLHSTALVVLTALLFALPTKTERLTAESGLLLPFGITPTTFASMDYYPLIPWLGVFIIGLVAGRHGYRQRKPRLPVKRGTGSICWLGRNSLIIYLVHQPLLLAVLYVLLG